MYFWCTVIRFPQHSRVTQGFIRPTILTSCNIRQGKETGIKARDRRVDSTPVTEGTPGENGHTNGDGYTDDNCMGLEKGTAKLKPNRGSSANKERGFSSFFLI